MRAKQRTPLLEHHTTSQHQLPRIASSSRTFHSRITCISSHHNLSLVVVVEVVACMHRRQLSLAGGSSKAKNRSVRRCGILYYTRKSIRCRSREMPIPMLNFSFLHMWPGWLNQKCGSNVVG